ALRKDVSEKADALQTLIPADTVSNLTRMKREIDLYWASLEPVFQWTLEEKNARGSEFVRTRVPRRAAILEIVSSLETLNQQTLAKQRQEVEFRQQELPVFVRRSVFLTILLGCA